jgi:hypothetical protein
MDEADRIFQRETLHQNILKTAREIENGGDPDPKEVLQLIRKTSSPGTHLYTCMCVDVCI